MSKVDYLFYSLRYRALKISVFLTQKIKNYQIWKALLDQFLKNEDYLDHTL